MASLGAAITNTVYQSETNTFLYSKSSSKAKTETVSIVSEQEFTNIMSEQFGFDQQTGQIMYKVYTAIQENYKDRSQLERDWCFARALSQLGDYNSKKVDIGIFEIETNAWRKGAGWIYKYDEEKDYFCNNLQISEKDYLYLRYMLRLQHFMTSNPDDYSYDAMFKNKKTNYKSYLKWKQNMETAMGVELSDDEYTDKYKLLYE